MSFIFITSTFGAQQCSVSVVVQLSSSSLIVRVAVHFPLKIICYWCCRNEDLHSSATSGTFLVDDGPYYYCMLEILLGKLSKSLYNQVSIIGIKC